MTKLLVPYYRVSTDDKGQDPERQKLACEPWAEREGFTLVPVRREDMDVGMSASKVPALQRPLFLAACERAQAMRAEGIIMETPDRFSRFEPDVAIWEKVEVEKRYGVRLYFACMTLEMQTTPIGKVFLFMQQAAAHIWVEDHRKKVLSGNARAKARGQRLGRKPKEVTFEEEQFIDGLRGEGWGWESIENKLNARRGVFELTDKKVAKQRSISASALKRWDRTRQAEKAIPESPVEMQNGPRDDSDGQSEAITDGGPA